MDADDGWPKVWAEMSDEELRGRLRHYLFLAANSPLKHAKRIAQLVESGIANRHGVSGNRQPHSVSGLATTSSSSA